MPLRISIIVARLAFAAAILATGVRVGAAPDQGSVPAANGQRPAPVAAPPDRRATPEEGAAARSLFAEGLRLEAQGDLRAASSAFERAYDADPNLAHAGVNAALLRERLGDGAAAGIIYARVLDHHPGFGPAVRSLVRLAIRAGDLAAAEREARARIARGPDSAAQRNALVDVLLAAGRLEEAAEESRRALKLDERSVPAMVNLATVYHRKKRHEIARMVLENARAIDDRDPTVWNRLGLVELASGNRAQALEDFRTAAALGPDYPEARANHGALLAEAEDFQAATTELEAAARYAPGNAAIWVNLGNAYRGIREFEKAEGAYRKALVLDPAMVDAELNLAVLYLDGEKPATPVLERLEQALAHLDAYEQKGGREPMVAEYRKDVGKAIEREKKRLAREERDRLRREAEATPTPTPAHPERSDAAGGAESKGTATATPTPAHPERSDAAGGAESKGTPTATPSTSTSTDADAATGDP